MPHGGCAKRRTDVRHGAATFPDYAGAVILGDWAHLGPDMLALRDVRGAIPSERVFNGGLTGGLGISG